MSNNKKQISVGFIGMTHLGINSAAASATKGFKTYCFDLSSQCISQLIQDKLPVSEPDLAETLSINKANIVFTDQLKILNQCDLIYISPDIPTDDSGVSDETEINALIKMADQQLSEDIPIVILSQVTPGFTSTFARNTKRTIYYQVETLIFGQAIQRALYPERIIIGTISSEKPLHQSYQAFLNAFECPILPMRYESAELAKIAINCCLVSSISVANTLAEICENIGADWSEIIPALKLDKRIGPYSYLTPGLGISGGNLERDLETIIQLSSKYGTHSAVVSKWIENSGYRKNWPFKTLMQNIQDIRSYNITISILGLAYKKDTDSIKNSPAIKLINDLPNHFILQTYDPAVPKECDQAYGCIRYDSPIEACANANITLIMTDWDELKNISLRDIIDVMNGNILIDPYGVFRNQAKNHPIKYYTLGVSSE